MVRKSPKSDRKSKAKPSHRPIKGRETEGTIEDFQREGMGIAAKE